MVVERYELLQCQAWLCWTLVITAAVSFDEDSFRCAGELEHSSKQHSSKQTAGDIYTAQLHTWSIDEVK